MEVIKCFPKTTIFVQKNCFFVSFFSVVVVVVVVDEVPIDKGNATPTTKPRKGILPYSCMSY